MYVVPCEEEIGFCQYVEHYSGDIWYYFCALQWNPASIIRTAAIQYILRSIHEGHRRVESHGSSVYCNFLLSSRRGGPHLREEGNGPEWKRPEFKKEPGRPFSQADATNTYSSAWGIIFRGPADLLWNLSFYHRARVRGKSLWCRDAHLGARYGD